MAEVGGGAPFEAGSMVALLSPHAGPATEAVAELVAQAALAEAAGFDGVVAGEHHAGFPGYLPNPLQAAGWFLERTERLWAAPCPLLLPLRPTRLVAEEVAWLTARHPGRVGLGVAAGAAEVDFVVAGLPLAERTARYRAALPELVALLRGDPGPLAGDAAIEACAAAPVPVVSATTTEAGVRLAASAGAGIMLDGFSNLARCRHLADRYRAAGGSGPVVLSRRVWLGESPRAVAATDRQRYAAFASAPVRAQETGDDTLVTDPDPEVVAAALENARTTAGADVLSLRLHLPGVEPVEVRDQLARVGGDVLPRLRRPAG